MSNLSSIQRAYLAGFLDADGSVYVRAKPNKTYKFGYQIASHIVFYQSVSAKKKFKKVYENIPFGLLRERSDGILEYHIRKQEELRKFITLVRPYVRMKSEQLRLLEKILNEKKKVTTEKSFNNLLKLVDMFGELNYSKRRKKRYVPVETERRSPKTKRYA